MMNFGMILIFASLATAPSPVPAASPTPSDVCGGAHTGLLATLDRPSIGYSPCAVKPHESLAELGYANFRGDSLLAAYPAGFLRFGAAPNLEVDFIGPAYAVQSNSGMRSAGFYDSGVGAKYEFWHDGSSAFGTDFLYTAPTGGAQFTAGSPFVTVNADYTTSLSSRFSFSSTLGFQSAYAADTNGSAGRFFALAPSVVLSDQWSPRAQAFVEAFGLTRSRPSGVAQFGLDAAFQYLLTPAFEVDVEAGRTTTDLSRAHYVGFGIGARF